VRFRSAGVDRLDSCDRRPSFVHVHDHVHVHAGGRELHPNHDEPAHVRIDGGTRPPGLRRALVWLWCFPTSLPGLLLAVLALASRGSLQRREGVLEVTGGWPAELLRHLTLIEGGASALTLGHVVIARSPALMEATRAHELVHVRQAERWGPLFLPAYLVASLAARLEGGHWYRDNRFEREAFERAGRGPLTRGGNAR